MDDIPGDEDVGDHDVGGSGEKRGWTTGEDCSKG